MTRDETKAIIMVIKNLYPNFHPDNISFLIDLWSVQLERHSYRDIKAALDTFIQTDRSGFAPSIGQLLGIIDDTSEEALSVGSAWNLVYKAICNSIYDAEAQFEKLPEDIRAAVGNPGNLKEWAMLDDKAITVVESNFAKRYEISVKRSREREILQIAASRASDAPRFDQKDTARLNNDNAHGIAIGGESLA